EEILSEGGSEGRERRIFGYTGSTLPTERRRNHRPRCATNRTVCAIGPSPAGVTEDPSLPPLGPTPLRISSQPLTAAKDLRPIGRNPERGWVRGAGAKDLWLHRIHVAHRAPEEPPAALRDQSYGLCNWAKSCRCDRRSFASAPRPHPAQDFFTTSERSEGSQ